MQSVLKSWFQMEGRAKLTQKLTRFIYNDVSANTAGAASRLADDSNNPYDKFLSLIEQLQLPNRKRRNDCIKDLTTSFDEIPDADRGNGNDESEAAPLASSSVSGAVSKMTPSALTPAGRRRQNRLRRLSDETRRRAFLQMIDREKMTFDLASRWCQVFDLGAEGVVEKVVIPRLESLIAAGSEADPEDLVVAAAVVANLSIYEKIDLEKLLIALLVAKKIQMVECLVNPSDEAQRRLLRILDRSVKSHVNEINMEPKSVTKLTSRLAKKYGVDTSTDLHLVCPNLFREKRDAAIRYNVYELLRNGAIDEATFVDVVEASVLRDNDPFFPEAAIYALDQMDREIGLTCFEDESLLARLAIKWSVPLEDLARDLPTVHRLVINYDGNASFAENNLPLGVSNDVDAHDRHRFTLMNIRDVPSSQLNASNGEEGPCSSSALLYFQFPLEADKAIELVDSRESYRAACASLTDSSLIGVDCEWASFKGSAGVVSLLQLATRGRVYLFDIKTLKKTLLPSEWSCVGSIITSESCMKLGYGIIDDLQLLAVAVPHLEAFIVPKARRNVVDLMTVINRIETLDPQLIRDYDIEQSGWDRISGGLSGVVQALLGKPLDKTPQRSDWDVRPLRPAQRKYAALDAYVSILLHDDLKKRISDGKGKLAHLDFAFFASGKLTPEEIVAKEKKEKEKKSRQRGGSQDAKDNTSGPITSFKELARAHANESSKSTTTGVPAGFYDTDSDDDDLIFVDEVNEIYIGDVASATSASATSASAPNESAFVASAATLFTSPEETVVVGPTVGDGEINSFSMSPVRVRGSGRGRARGRARYKDDQSGGSNDHNRPGFTTALTSTSQVGGRGRGRSRTCSGGGLDREVAVVGRSWTAANGKVDALGKLSFGRGCSSRTDLTFGCALRS